MSLKFTVGQTYNYTAQDSKVTPVTVLETRYSRGVARVRFPNANGAAWVGLSSLSDDAGNRGRWN